MPIKLFHGDCLDILTSLPENSVDSIVTDPPYGLAFMGAKWDYDVPSVAIWKEALRVLRPGGHMLAFSGTRTYHRMVVNIEDAGFEIRDQLCWLNSQGMPHGLDISKALDKTAGVKRKVVGTKVTTYDGAERNPDNHQTATHEGNLGQYGYKTSPHGIPLTEPVTDQARQWEGWNTTLKPCMEPIVLCRKPLDGTIIENITQHGVGGLNIDGCRIPIDPEVDDPRLGGEGSWGTEKAAKLVYQGGYAGERVGSSPLGRYPSGIIHDGSNEILEVFDSFGEKASGVPGKRRKAHTTHSMSGTLDMLDRDEVGYADKGSVSRFFKSCEYSEEERRIFYCGKVKPKERGSSKHPTLKPIKLMEYLCRLITPKGGTILDPFAGSGTTGMAAINEGCSAILIEREQEYYDECRDRLMFFLED